MHCTKLMKPHLIDYDINTCHFFIVDCSLTKFVVRLSSFWTCCHIDFNFPIKGT